MIFTNENGILTAKRQGETLRIQAWGKDALRVQSTMYPTLNDQDWALTETVPAANPQVEIFEISQKSEGGGTETHPIARITNGRISAEVNHVGIITLFRDGKKILREYFRNYGGTLSRESRCLKAVNREYIPWTAGEYKLRVKFESNDGEKIYGMGQYQQPYLNLAGCVLDLEQRNSQITVPFAVSSLGYGLLWNNPAVGRVSFGKNIYEWTAEATKQMDYWICAGENPKDILEKYTSVTGRSPMIRDDVLGLWQSKLRYRTQEEVLEVAHKYQDAGIPLDVIVIDFFHWTLQGDWKWDKQYWPDPKAMIDELHSMGIKVVVSVWPSVDRKSENFYPMVERGLLMRTERGAMQTYDYQGDCVEIDPTNPETRQYIWDVCKKNYYDAGVDVFWLDNSEPDLTKYDFDNFRYYIGPALEVSNIYPQYFSRAFYENEVAGGNTQVLNLLRSGWAGSQKYANMIWSGDVPSTFEALQDQLSAGLNMGLAGIAWWTTDIGGFMTTDINEPEFHQLLIRWFEFAVFTAALRMHGDRGPYNIPSLDDRDWGGGYLHTGWPNELWSYGEDVYAILKKNLDLRLSLKDYIKELFAQAHTDGSPLIRTMFYEFPEDPTCWELTDQYMFGSAYLVAPVLHLDEFERTVYLPAGSWEDIRDHKTYTGGQTILADAPLDSIPVFKRLS